MLAVLSPAKTMNLDPIDVAVDASQPTFMKEATSLMRTARGLTQKQLRDLMGLSKDLAKVNYDRYRAFDLPFNGDNAMPAALMFDGDVYRGLSARTLTPDDLAWAQDRVAILSGMFGLLRPLDLIQPYRLEMGTRLKTRRGRNLYAYWGRAIGKEIEKRLAEHDDRTLVNLASGEYFKAVRGPTLRTIDVVFHDYKDDAKTPNIISFMAKRARGLMARHIIDQRVDRVAGLRDFAGERYKLDMKLSNERMLVFGRKFMPVSPVPS